MRLLASVLAGLVVAAASAGALACTLPGAAKARLQSERHVVVVRTLPERIEVGQPFSVELAVCGAPSGPIERVGVDAHMPDHRHGMNYKPKIEAHEAGRYTARNLLFHMGGKWEILVDVRSGGRTDRLAWPVNVD